jgi:copper homeostasis protein
MTSKLLIEISVETPEAALAAQRGGANRVELCGDLSVGGVTPSVELIRAVRELLQIPIYSMVRPRGGDFLYSRTEFESMQADIAAAKSLGMHGVVLGILKPGQLVDVERTQQLVDLADPLPVTFHRAFDACHDLKHALEDVIATGAARLLTSGGASSALDGVSVLADLVEVSQSRIAILPGAGINPSNILQIAKATRAREFHSGLSSSLPRTITHYDQFESEVRKLANKLALL